MLRLYSTKFVGFCGLQNKNICEVSVFYCCNRQQCLFFCKTVMQLPSFFLYQACISISSAHLGKAGGLVSREIRPNLCPSISDQKVFGPFSQQMATIRLIFEKIQQFLTSGSDLFANYFSTVIRNFSIDFHILASKYF